MNKLTRDEVMDIITSAQNKSYNVYAFSAFMTTYYPTDFEKGSITSEDELLNEFEQRYAGEFDNDLDASFALTQNGELSDDFPEMEYDDMDMIACELFYADNSPYTYVDGYVFRNDIND